MLGIDRHDLARSGRPQDQRTPGHQRLLIRKREPGARLERGQRRSQAQRPHQRVEYDVRVGLLDQSGHRLGPVETDVTDLLSRALVGDGDIGDAGLGALPQQRFHARAPGGQPDHLEAVRIGGDDLQRLGAD